MTTAEESRIARAAAAALAAEMPEGFVPAVEAELAGSDHGAPKTFLDPGTAIALGSLLVSAASLAWTIYKDLKAETAKPAPSVVARKVRLQLRDAGAPESAQATRIVEVVVDEVTKAEAP